MRNNLDNNWVSLHIFFNGDIYSTKADRVLKDIVQPFVELSKTNGWIAKYFFIRYNELGPHLRLRLQLKKEDCFNQLLEKFNELIADNYPEDLKPVIKNKDGSVEKYLLINYEPEIERYGGMEGIGVAEEFFFHSSEFCVTQVKELNSDDTSFRFGKGLIGMIALLKVFVDDKASAGNTMAYYRSGYLKAFAKEEFKDEWLKMFDSGFEKQSNQLIEYIQQIWDALDDIESLPESLLNYAVNLRSIKEKLLELCLNGKIVVHGKVIEHWNEITASILPSYIHMHNNRLGISIRDESYLAHLIHNGLIQTGVLQNEQ
ncbi:MAG: thiopeptide-type bacteriocin biosynthesis protein [Melioribacteraceae bacterium]